jgi:hypothetical protein
MGGSQSRPGLLETTDTSCQCRYSNSGPYTRYMCRIYDKRNLTLRSALTKCYCQLCLTANFTARSPYCQPAITTHDRRRSSTKNLTGKNVNSTNFFSSCSFPVKITIDQKQLDNVESFKHLGSILTNDGRCTCEIKCRNAMAKAACI